MSRKTGRKWKTEKCGRCGEAHNGYSGKLNSMGVEYVVCGRTNKPMNITSDPRDPRDVIFRTTWVEDNG